MTKENTGNKEPDFASPEAGESWAQAKKEYGDVLNIDDVKGTGKDGAIKASDVDAYVESLTGGDADKAEAEKKAQADADAKAKADADKKAQDDADAKAKADKEAKDKADAEAKANEKSNADAKPTAKDFKAVEPIKGKALVNLTPNKFEIEGVKIEPKGKVKMTDELAKSKRVAHGITIGVLGVE